MTVICSGTAPRSTKARSWTIGGRTGRRPQRPFTARCDRGTLGTRAWRAIGICAAAIRWRRRWSGTWRRTRRGAVRGSPAPHRSPAADRLAATKGTMGLTRKFFDVIGDHHAAAAISRSETCRSRRHANLAPGVGAADAIAVVSAATARRGGSDRPGATRRSGFRKARGPTEGPFRNFHWLLCQVRQQPGICTSRRQYHRFSKAPDLKVVTHPVRYGYPGGALRDERGRRSCKLERRAGHLGRIGALAECVGNIQVVRALLSRRV